MLAFVAVLGPDAGTASPAVSMLTVKTPAPIASPPALRLAATAAQGAVFASWLLLVLKYQYGARWLAGYEIALDALFLAAFSAAAVTRLAERRGVARARCLVLRVALAVVMSGAALVASEYVLRYAFRTVRVSADGRDYISGLQAGPPVLQNNSLGFREREIPPKRADRFRIVVIGDSFTFGNGLPEKDRLSNVLEAHLGPQYEVLNFGVPGNNIPEHLDVLDKALGVSPDFVLLQLFANDFETATMVRPHSYPLLPGTLDRRLYRSSLVYDFMSRGWKRLQEVVGITDSYATYMERSLGDPATPESQLTLSQLRAFFQRTAAAGVPAGGVVYPFVEAMRASGRGYPFTYLHDRVRQACGAEQVVCVDLLEEFSRVRDVHKLKVSPLDAHPSALANSRAAVQILQSFRAQWGRR